ncbi:MAG: M24 family metallopeptidase, partial [Phycisphaerales bacterium]
MGQAGAVVARVLQRVGQMVQPGVTTAELNEEAERIIAETGGTPLFKGVEHPRAKFPFPAALCTSINEEV